MPSEKNLHVGMTKLTVELWLHPNQVEFLKTIYDDFESHAARIVASMATTEMNRLMLAQMLAKTIEPPAEGLIREVPAAGENPLLIKKVSDEPGESPTPPDPGPGLEVGPA